MLDFAPRRSSGTELSGSHRTGYRSRRTASSFCSPSTRTSRRRSGKNCRSAAASMCRCFRCGCRRLPRAAPSDTSSRSANGLIFFRTGSKRWPRSLKRSRTPLFSLTRARSWRRPIVRQRPSVKRCRNVRQPEDSAPPAPIIPSGSPQFEAIRALLARHIGPIARVFVERAASEARSPDEFCEQLASRVSSPADRAAFIRTVREQLGKT